MWIKICGVTDEAAVAAALDAQVDAIGFVFAPSVRRLQPAQAAALARCARGKANLIAVTLHPEQSLVDEIVRVFKPDTLQSDLADFAALQLPDSLARLPVLRSATADSAIADSLTAGRILFEGARSGSGERGDWGMAARLSRSHELVLAGGLDADNVAAAIAIVRPYGVDVSSGVEATPGQKSVEKIARFVAAANAAFEGGMHGNRCSV
jgi:phosphoribosylanthranilate isomerase